MTRVYITYSAGASSSGAPGCPDCAACTASTVSARTVLMLSCSIDCSGTDGAFRVALLHLVERQDRVVADVSGGAELLHALHADRLLRLARRLEERARV